MLQNSESVQTDLLSGASSQDSCAGRKVIVSLDAKPVASVPSGIYDVHFDANDRLRDKYIAKIKGAIFLFIYI
eukprot:scaffold249308_cov70-Cyclotella_meneghiniana.AAC.13